MIRCCLLLLLAASATANAIVIRDDVDDGKYRLPASEFTAFVDMRWRGPMRTVSVFTCSICIGMLDAVFSLIFLGNDE